MYEDELTTADCDAILELAEHAFNNMEDVTDRCSAFGGVFVPYQERVYLVGDDYAVIALPRFVRHAADGLAFVIHNDQRYADGLLEGRRQARHELRAWLDED